MACTAHPHRDGRNKSGHDNRWSTPMRATESKQRKRPMTKLELLLEEIVTANRILAREGVVDSFGHVSARHPDNPQRFLLSRARAPDCIEIGDIMEFTLDGDAGQCGRARALSRALHPRRHLRGAAGRPLGRAQSQPERHSVRGDRRASSSRSCTCAPISATRCRSGIPTTSSAIPRSWSTAWRWAAISRAPWARAAPS